ncbi:hypothetical protein IU449_26755 [Nocardia higoensis]|uniref:Uncharacterized protein n=1 Tax=Nocardia higoensis TaxID=228599 RepID=A0ABS0DIY5_9NOCA|nr:hypothetical protein [Nocardia higoensis]MBF6358100.1 hypothetical protein [Nocardia higoensis]
MTENRERAEQFAREMLGESYWSEHTPGMDCPCGPGYTERDIELDLDGWWLKATGIRHRWIVEPVSWTERRAGVTTTGEFT